MKNIILALGIFLFGCSVNKLAPSIPEVYITDEASLPKENFEGLLKYPPKEIEIITANEVNQNIGVIVNQSIKIELPIIGNNRWCVQNINSKIISLLDDRIIDDAGNIVQLLTIKIKKYGDYHLLIEEYSYYCSNVKINSFEANLKTIDKL